VIVGSAASTAGSLNPVENAWQLMRASSLHEGSEVKRFILYFISLFLLIIG
jgi:hypothetical protein